MAAKELLIRWAYSEDLQSFKPAVREFVFTVDDSRLFIGTETGPKEIAYVERVLSMIDQAIAEATIKSGTTIELQGTLKKGQLAFDKTKKRLVYRNPDTNVVQQYTTTSDLPLKTPVNIVVQQDNIDTNDNNSVTIVNFNRPFAMVFVNGTLATESSASRYRISVDFDNETLKVYGLSAGDVVSYF